MRWSKYFLQTVREVPGDAEAISHVLLSRAGMMRRVAAGVYALTPLGLRSNRKTEAIVREEMDRAGFHEVEIPILQPRELWEESGRWQRYVSEEILFHLKDRKANEYCLAPTAEEAFTTMVRAGVTSYRQLPFTLYQIRTKFRDEIRPRFGLMRGREFLMYDGYSFDADAAGLDESYRRQDAAYRRVFQRCGLDFTVVEADSGGMGGSQSQEFMVLADTGEDAVVRCAACGYGANLERAQSGRRRAPWEDETVTPRADVETPGKGGIDDVVAFLGITASRMLKCLIYETEQGIVAAVAARGPRRQRGGAAACARGRAPGPRVRGEGRARRRRAGRLRRPAPSRRREGAPGRRRIRARRGQRRDRRRAPRLARAGILDGARREGLALGGLRPGARGRPLPAVREAAVDRPGDRGRAHLQARHQVRRVAAAASSPTRRGRRVRSSMGSYGIGIGRTMAAAVEQNHDADGIVWPLALAPFEIELVSLNATEPPTAKRRTPSTRALLAADLDVFYDDRDERPGVKFKDADLLGLPDPRQRRRPGAEGRQRRDRDAPRQEGARGPARRRRSRRSREVRRALAGGG